MKTDVVILGAGPVGLFSAFYAGMRDLNSIVVDQLEEVGGQLSALYPEKNIYDVAGFPQIKAKDLIHNLVEQNKRFEDKIEYSLSNTVLNINKVNEEFIVKTTKGDISTKSVIIAGGNGGFTPRTLGVENEENLGIDYFIKDMENYKDKDVVIFGGGDSAVDFSLMLENVAKSVHIVHRRNEFRAHDHSINLLKESSVNIYTPYNIESIKKEDNKYNVNIKDNDGNIKSISANSVICNFGFISKLGSIEEFGLDIQRNKIKVNTRQETNISGVFAIGDICTYDGKANLIISGFGEAPIAVNQVYEVVTGKKAGMLHSSSVIS